MKSYIMTIALGEDDQPNKACLSGGWRSTGIAFFVFRQV
jgi:hypothetical protein